MQTKFKRHQKVQLLTEPNYEYVEYETEKAVEIKKGAKAEINMLLPNGQYHVRIFDKKGNVVAYAPMSEDDLSLIEEE